MFMYKVSEIPSNKELSNYIFDPIEKMFSDALKDFTFYEFDLQELGLPSHEYLLEQTKKYEEKAGLQGWRVRGKECEDYKGLSLTYNKDFYNPNASIYHQTLGMFEMKDSYGKAVGGTHIENKKNSYYDTLGFRYIDDFVYNLYKDLFDKINGPISRGRISYFYPHLRDPYDNRGWHTDEPPLVLCRINIPLQTNSNHVIRMKGEDGFGNSFELEKHFELGKAYIWNTKIPHEVTFKEKTTDPTPRIHMVLGFLPWLDYDKDTDTFYNSENFGKSMHEIITKKLFIKD